jgi:ABC-type cobalamin/Fe3+-siderophores transport system ATPase subunit
MEVKDLSWNEVITKRFNHPLLPKSIRGVIIGKSGCGKTTLLLNLLLRPGWLDYNRLFVFGKSLFQPEYRILKKAFEEKLPKEAIIRLFNQRDEVIKLDVSPSAIVEEMAKDLQDKSDIECSFYELAEDVPDPRD